MKMPTHIVAVAGITEDGSGNILMVKTQRGEWAYPGGRVEEGENLIDALIRKTKEESGLDIEVLKIIGVYSNTRKYVGYNGVDIEPTKVMIDFICKIVGVELCTSNETSESCWVPKGKVLEMITSPSLKERFKTYLSFQGKIKYCDYVTRPEYELKKSTYV